ERSRLQQVAELVDHHPLIHSVEPGQDFREQLHVRLIGQVALGLRKRNFDFELFGECEVNRKYGTSFRPLRLPRRLRGRLGLHWSWDIQCGKRFGHGCVTQSQAPCRNRTATALRPSWYCTATTVASCKPLC